MTTKEWLMQARDLDDLINAKLEERDRWLALACRVTGNITPDKVQTSPGNTSEAAFLKYAALSEEIDRYVDRLVDLKREITEAIHKVPEKRLQTLLIEYYLNHKTWEQVAVTMNYGYRQVIRLHEKALLKVKDVIECHID